MCEPCSIAKVNARTGHYSANCRACKARALAQAPQFFESIAAEAITPAYRDSLQAAFGAGWKEAHAEVRAWHERITASKNQRREA